MRLLLDTHVLIWWLDGDPRVRRSSREIIADPENEILVSMVTLWEIVLKLRTGKYDVDMGEIDRAIDEVGITRLGVAPSHLTELLKLPAFHRDPFDHLLIAQAVAEDAMFVSADRAMGQYPVRLMEP